MNNRELGNAFERELCEKLSESGFWVHNMAQNQAGQPADIIAVRNKRAYLIDAKVCSDNRFPLSRIEENQKLAMLLWQECGNSTGWFAFLIGGEIFMMTYGDIEDLLKNQSKSTLTLSDIVDNGMSLGKWVKPICR